MGLLDNIGKFLSDEETQLNLASGFAGLSGNPNAGNIQQGLQNRLSVLQDDRKLKNAQELASSKLQLQTQQAMRLIGQEYPDIAQAIQGGFMTPNEGVMEAMKRKNEPDKSFNMLTTAEVKAAGLDTTLMYQKGSDGKIYQIGGNGTNVSIDARSGSEVGTIPQGYELITDKNGNRKLQAIVGGEAAKEIQDAAIRKDLQQETTNRTAVIVLEDIARLKTLLQNQSNLNPLTAVTGPIATEVASGFSASARSDAEGLVRTIGGNIGFDRLQRMRNESKTGGALGAINAQEMQLLQDVMGSLQLSQSEEALQTNLNRLADIYTVIMNKANAYPNASQHGFGASIEPSSSAIPTWNPTGGSNGKGAFE